MPRTDTGIQGYHALLLRSAGPSGGLELRYSLSEYDIIAMIGTSDQSCRLL